MSPFKQWTLWRDHNAEGLEVSGPLTSTGLPHTPMSEVSLQQQRIQLRRALIIPTPRTPPSLNSPFLGSWDHREWKATKTSERGGLAAQRLGVFLSCKYCSLLSGVSFEVWGFSILGGLGKNHTKFSKEAEIIKWVTCYSKRCSPQISKK